MYTLDIKRGHSGELALVLDVVIRPCTVHGHAVVPNHWVTFGPFVKVHKLTLDGVLHQVFEQQPAFMRKIKTHDVSRIDNGVVRMQTID